MKHHCTSACVPWVGTQKAHCATCGATFSVVANFDRHRVNGECQSPEEVGLRPNTRGVWIQEGEVDWDERFKAQV